MKHAREDYNRIQDPAGLIPADEPVFLIRAKDQVGPDVVERWANFAEHVGASAEIVAKARTHAETMRAWQRTHGKQVPDLLTCDCASPNGTLHDVACSTGLGVPPVEHFPPATDENFDRAGLGDTPRTDARLMVMAIAGGNHHVVFASVARDLERELVAARMALADVTPKMDVPDTARINWLERSLRVDAAIYPRIGSFQIVGGGLSTGIPPYSVEAPTLRGVIDAAMDRQPKVGDPK